MKATSGQKQGSVTTARAITTAAATDPKKGRMPADSAVVADRAGGEGDRSCIAAVRPRARCCSGGMRGRGRWNEGVLGLFLN